MYKIIFILLLFGNCVAYSQNTIDCNTWLTNPCGTFGGCPFATAKLYPFYPYSHAFPTEYNLPINDNCSGGGKSLELGPRIYFSSNTCTNRTITGFQRFCFEPNSAEYAKIFIHKNGNDFLNNLSTLMGTYNYNLIINPVDNSLTSVSVEQGLVSGTAKVDFGTDNGLNFGTDIFYVSMGVAQGYLFQYDWHSLYALGGTGQYMAQSYIDAIHNKSMFGSSDSGVILDKKCNVNSPSQVIATLLYQIETDSTYGIGREKLHKVINEAINKFSLNLQQNLNKPAPFATSFFKTCTQINSLNPTLLSGNDLCKIKTVISNYFTPNCDQPTLDDVVDYYIADDISDIGIQPNPSNASEWESPAIINRNAPDGLFTNQSAKADTENTLYIEIKNAGCDSLVDARLEIYYALSQTGLTWDDAWDNNIITVGNTDIQAGAKIADIILPSISTEGIRVPVTWTPPNIDALNIPSTKINLLVRIVSATDVMQETEVKDIRSNVRNNNNIAWKVLQLEK
jgi:hypothetical protein